MPELKFSGSEVKALVTKLATMEDQFTAQEKEILLGVFGMASAGLSAAVARTQQAHPETKAATHLQKPASLGVASSVDPAALPSLGEALQASFVAGKPAGFALGGALPPDDSIGVSVGGHCISVSWSKELRDFIGPVSAGPIDIGPGPATSE